MLKELDVREMQEVEIGSADLTFPKKRFGPFHRIRLLLKHVRSEDTVH